MPQFNDEELKHILKQFEEFFDSLTGPQREAIESGKVPAKLDLFAGEMTFYFGEGTEHAEVR